jgi:hypothetical protein
MLFSEVAPKLATFGLLMRDKVHNHPALRTSEAGNALLAKLAIERAAGGGS